VVGQARQLRADTARDRYRVASELATGGRHRDCRDALAELEEATRQAPQRFSAWLLKALCHWRCGEYDRAEVACTVCVALRPGYAWAYFQRGLARLERRAWKGAEDDFTEVLKADPSLAPARVWRAKARIEQQNYFAAVRD